MNHQTKSSDASGQGARSGAAERHDLSAWRVRDELRRSNAAQLHRNRKRYSRRAKYPGLDGGI